MKKSQKLTKNIHINWGPQNRQYTLLKACGLSWPWDNLDKPSQPIADVIGYGGAAGGGKTDCLLAIAIIGGLSHAGISIGYFRREYPMLEGPGGAILRSHELMSGWAAWNGSERRWTFPNGSILQFCHASDELDVHKYQCFRPDTEILTLEGFKNVANIEIGELVATMNPETREMEYKPITKTHKYFFDGELIVSDSKRCGVSFAVTPNHEMWFSTAKNNKLRKCRADSLPHEPIFPTYAKWRGITPPQTITFNGIGNHGKTYVFDAINWFKFLGWYIAEGSLRNSLKGGYRVYISQTKEKGKNEIRSILNALGINYHEIDDGFCFASKPICEYLERFGDKADKKRLTPELKSLDTPYLEILLDSLVAGDGTWYKRGKVGHFVTSSQRLADDVMEIAIKCGYRASITKQERNGHNGKFGDKPAYHVCLYNKKGDTRTRKIWRERYVGDVYCVTVPPYHTVLIRHRGKIMWTGQSQQFDILLIDEATQFTRYQYRYLLTRNRATRDGITPFAVLATNPGGIGHAWFFVEFVNIGAPEEVHLVEVEPGTYEKHLFLPAKLSDNIILERRDPRYRKILEAQPEIVRRQLLEGDWNAFAGQYFKSWRRDIHVIPTPKPLEKWLNETIHHRKFRCLDYGLDMTACYWIDVGQDSRLIVYRELYEPNLTLSQAARRIVAATTSLEEIKYTVASPDLWNRRQDVGRSGMEIMAENGLRGLVKADNRRVEGWWNLLEFLEPIKDPESDKMTAQLRFFDVCANAIRTIPSLVADENNPNDVSDKCEDHAAEAIRYGCMSRPKPSNWRPDPLENLRKLYPEWTPEYQIHSREIMRVDPKREIGLEDLGM